MARLALVPSVHQEALRTNITKVCAHLADLILNCWTNEAWQDLIGAEFIEIWYWYDGLRERHKIVIIGDCPPMDEGYWDEGQPLTQKRFGSPEFLYYIAPMSLYCALANPAATPYYYNPTAVRKRFVKFWNRRLIGKLNRSPAVSSIATPDIGPISSPNEEDWEAALVLLDWMNRIPAVPLSQAAALLTVDIKTIRNRIEAGELEAVRRRGTLYVTKRSIKHYVQKNIYPTPQFNLWSEVELHLKQERKKREKREIR
jgi:hypothetical protein